MKKGLNKDIISPNICKIKWDLGVWRQNINQDPGFKDKLKAVKFIFNNNPDLKIRSKCIDLLV